MLPAVERSTAVSPRRSRDNNLIMRSSSLFGAIVVAAAYSPKPQRVIASPVHRLIRPALQSAPCCSADQSGGDDESDSVLFYGDALVLLAYGSVTALFDVWLSRAPDAITIMSAPVVHAPSQAIVIALLWLGITFALHGYRANASLWPLIAAWVGSSTIMLAVYALFGSPGPVPIEEINFVLGTAVAVGGWRYAYSQGLPLP